MALLLWRLDRVSKTPLQRYLTATAVIRKITGQSGAYPAQGLAVANETDGAGKG